MMRLCPLSFVAAVAGVLLCGSVACSSHDPATATGSDGGTSVDAATGAEDASLDSSPAPPDAESATACNGHDALCARRFDQVAYPCTHNAYSAAEYGFQKPYVNQTNGLAKQLEDGVRCMMLDVYEDPDVDGGGVRALCHVSCALAKKSHLEALASIKQFLDAHPREVLTLDYEDYVPATEILADLTTAGLADMISLADPSTAPWPTLGDMIASNRRIVVGVEGHTTTSGFPAGIHDFYAIAWDTPYTFTTPADFTCAQNRGAMSSALFLVNHWLSTSDLPDETKAPLANAYDTLHGRAQGCADQTKHFVNFLAVDFYDVGDLFRTVDALNGL